MGRGVEPSLSIVVYSAMDACDIKKGMKFLSLSLSIYLSTDDVSNLSLKTPPGRPTSLFLSFELLFLFYFILIGSLIFIKFATVKNEKHFIQQGAPFLLEGRLPSNEIEIEKIFLISMSIFIRERGKMLINMAH